MLVLGFEKGVHRRLYMVFEVYKIGGNCMHWKLGFFFLVISRDKARSINEATSFVSCGLQTIPINESKLMNNSVVLNKG